MNPTVEKFKAVGEPTRLRILRVLLEAADELCVCEIVDTLRKPLYTVSRNLTVLRQAGLVEERRQGKYMMYRLCLGPVNGGLFSLLRQLPPEDPLYRDDAAALSRRLAAGGAGGCGVPHR